MKVFLVLLSAFCLICKAAHDFHVQQIHFPFNAIFHWLIIVHGFPTVIIYENAIN